MKDVLKILAESVLIPLGLTAAALAVDAGIYKKLGSGTTTLIMPNKKVKDIMKIVKSHEDSELLLKGDNKTIDNKLKEKRSGFLNML